MTNVQENVVNYLLNNMEDAKQLVRELNSWDGSFENLDVHSNDEEFFDMMYEGRPMEAVRAAHYGEYNYNDEFVRINAYGNLESLDEYDYEQEIKDQIEEIADMIVEKRDNIYLDAELEEILDEEEEDEDEE